MRRFSYTTKGTCSRQILFSLDDEQRVHDVQFVGGCAGNTVGVATLAEGRKAEELVALLNGIPCGMKGTSCPDQLSRAIAAAVQAGDNQAAE